MYDGDRDMQTLPDGSILDCEKVANEGKYNDLYLLNSNRAKKITWRAFDILSFQGVDVTRQPLTERLRLLTTELRELADPRFQLAEEVGWALDRDSVMRLKEEAVARGYEGVVVKPAKSTYYGMPWLKLKKHNTQDLVVLAVKKTKSWLDHSFPAAFLVGHFNGAGYKADGVVSSGLSSKDKARIGARVNRLKWREDQDFVWITPTIVIEVQYTGLVNGSLREPRMLRVRSDKTPQQCLNPPFLVKANSPKDHCLLSGSVF